MSALDSSQAHARHAWTCPCGRTVRGNGGKASHQRACLTWVAYQLGQVEEVLAKIGAGTWGKNFTPKIVANYRHQFELQRDRLRERLGLGPVYVAADYTQDEPGECWAVRDGRREVHDRRRCEHYLQFAPVEQE